jgi:hypothetical protein
MSGEPLTEDELRIALANVGVDITCAACAELFYTGHRNAKHTHEDTPAIRALKAERDNAISRELWARECLVEAREQLRVAETARDAAREALGAWKSAARIHACEGVPGGFTNDDDPYETEIPGDGPVTKENAP